MKTKSLADAVETARSAPDPVGDEFGDGDAGRRSRPRVVFVRLPPAEHQAIKRLAIDRDTTTQGLMEEAIDDLFIKYNRKPR